MSTFMQLEVVFLVIFSATLVWGQQCNPAVTAQCMQRHATSMTDSYPRNKEELQKKCNDLSNIADCIKNGQKNCNEDIKKLFNGIHAFRIVVCDFNSPMAKGLMQHGECLSKANVDMLSCIQSKGRPGASNPCPVVLQIVECSDKVFGVQCGADANQLAKNTYGINLQATCPKEVEEHLLSANDIEHLSSTMGSTDTTQSMDTKTSITPIGSSANSQKYTMVLAFLLPAAMLLMKLLRVEI